MVHSVSALGPGQISAGEAHVGKTGMNQRRRMLAVSQLHTWFRLIRVRSQCHESSGARARIHTGAVDTKLARTRGTIGPCRTRCQAESRATAVLADTSCSGPTPFRG